MTEPTPSFGDGSAEGRLAAGFAAQVGAWALAAGANAASALAAGHAAAALSAATSAGHVCTTLPDLPPLAGGPTDAAAWRQALRASGVVGTPDEPGARPLIVDGDDRLYLHRYFDYERRLAQRLARARTAVVHDADTRLRLQARLAGLFAGNAGRTADSTQEPADWQKLAAALALRSRLTIISGGPGTGKTTTVVNLLACLIELDPACRIALAAPTGKAAARLTEAVRQRAGHLPEALRQALPAESFTVHRLLGVLPGGGGFVHHAGNRLAIDALVVDEASMLDLSLATQLLEAVPDSARIVLLGDKDQLSAVESGAVFAELVVDPSLSAACVHDLAGLADTPAERIHPPRPAAPSALHDAVVWFTQNFRFASDSGIGRLATLVNANQAALALDHLRGGGDGSLHWVDDGAAVPSPATWQAMADGHAAFVDAVRRDPADAHAVSDAFARFRILCAVRDGPRGVVAVNAELARRFRAVVQPQGSAGSSPWFVGRPVLVQRNDPVLGLFNGDIGIALPDAGGELMVFFPDPAGGLRAVAPVRLPPHETAFAMTVHKSQGSEFDAVLVLLPAQRSRVLARELLYTAVTRARSSVTLCATAGVIASTIATSTRRHSGLLARLRDCGPASFPTPPTDPTR